MSVLNNISTVLKTFSSADKISFYIIHDCKYTDKVKNISLEISSNCYIIT